MEKDLRARIAKCLQAAGLSEVPLDDLVPLSHLGFDSIQYAMTIIELEREFKIRISLDLLSSNPIGNLADLASLVRKAQSQSSGV